MAGFDDLLGRIDGAIYTALRGAAAGPAFNADIGAELD
jgi:hypothetical protein